MTYIFVYPWQKCKMRLLFSIFFSCTETKTFKMILKLTPEVIKMYKTVWLQVEGDLMSLRSAIRLKVDPPPPQRATWVLLCFFYCDIKWYFLHIFCIVSEKRCFCQLSSLKTRWNKNTFPCFHAASLHYLFVFVNICQLLFLFLEIISTFFWWHILHLRAKT